MTTRVQNIIDGLEALAPGRLAEDWDNVGLQVGHPEWPAGKVLVALDPTPAVVEEAIQEGATTIVTHHPLDFPTAALPEPFHRNGATHPAAGRQARGGHYGAHQPRQRFRRGQ